jgi:hypothetical protein
MSSRPSCAASAMNSTVRQTLAWLRTTPRGSPVLPEVYWMKATSSSLTTGKGGADASTSRSDGSSTCRTLAAAAADSSTPFRNQPMVTTALASESRKMLAVASTPRVG